MRLILGGRHMGKRAYAEACYGPFHSLCDLSRDAPESAADAELVVNLQEGVRALLLRGTDVRAFFEARLARLRRSVLIGDEIGSGVVPMDPFERRWRDETGLLYQYLAREAETVERVWAGLAVKIKG